MVFLVIEAAILVLLAALTKFFGGSKVLWLLWLFIFADFVLLIVTLIKKLKAKKQNPIPTLDQTFEYSGSQFEEYVASVLDRCGYKILSIKKSCDKGIDIIARRFFLKIGIQVKCYNHTVGNRAVQEAAAGKKFYKLNKVMVITNSIFTKSAYELAKKNKVRLVDRRQLVQMVKRANNN